ncbi:MAG: type I 3-dehydroquinate dehydratase [Chlamydiota bacterium]
MLILSLLCQNEKELFQKIKKIPTQDVDGIEIRWDGFSQIPFSSWQQIKKDLPFPCLFTLRKKSQGGLFQKNEEERKILIQKLCELEPEFFDIEYDTSKDFVLSLQSQYPNLKIISSYHNFSNTPSHLSDVYSLVKNAFPAHLYKIVTYAHSILDTLRMILFTKEKNTHTQNLIGFCMGEQGEISRILAPFTKSPFTFASLDEQITAPGQLSFQTLNQTYHFKKISPQTSLYGRLGLPNKKSLSHVTHNQVFFDLGFSALYLKIDVKEEELPSFLEMAQKVPFQGFSVTMPLKEKILPDQSINTLWLTNEHWEALSTDGIGALKALEEKTSIKNKKILLVGAGGAAKAILQKLIFFTDDITIFNRTDEKGKKLAKEFSCHSLSSKDLSKPPEYDILIQASSCGMTTEEMPILESWILPGKIIFECILSPTLLVQKGIEKGCTVIVGKSLFYYQALEQYFLWFPDIDRKRLKETLKKALTCFNIKKCLK